MPEDLIHRLAPPALSVIFLVLVGGALEAAYRAGLAKHRAKPDAAATGVGPIEGTVYGLFGLLFAFTFSLVAGRSEVRRGLVVEEANDIGTSYLRCALAPEPEQANLQRLMRDYLDARIEFSVAGYEPGRIEAATARSGALQAEIWRVATDLMRREPRNEGYALLLDSLNSTFDIQTTRLVSLQRHLAPSVVGMLFVTAALTAAVAGYATGLKGERHPLTWLVFVVLLGIVIYVVLDLDRPRRGLFRTPPAVLLDLRRSLQADER
jgi:hypothetical protein